LEAPEDGGPAPTRLIEPYQARVTARSRSLTSKRLGT
jgi:hypothetical protein